MPQSMTAPGINSMGQVDDGTFSKAANDVVSGLAAMYKQAHIQDPGGPVAQSLQDLMSAVADVEAQYQGAGQDPSQDPMAPQPDAAVPMDGDAEAAQMQADAQAAGPPPATMDQAGDQMQTMLEMANARKRPPTG